MPLIDMFRTRINVSHAAGSAARTKIGPNFKVSSVMQVRIRRLEGVSNQLNNPTEIFCICATLHSDRLRTLAEPTARVYPGPVGNEKD
jgi:hypothetical protein